MNINDLRPVSYEVIGDHNLRAQFRVWQARKLAEIAKTHPALAEHVRQNPAEFKAVFRSWRGKTETRSRKRTSGRTVARTPKRAAGGHSPSTSAAYLPPQSTGGNSWRL